MTLLTYLLTYSKLRKFHVLLLTQISTDWWRCDCPQFSVRGTWGPRDQRPAVCWSSRVLSCTLRVSLPRWRHILDGQRQVEMDEAVIWTAAENDDELSWRQQFSQWRVTTTWRRVETTTWTKHRPLFCTPDCCPHCYQWPWVTLWSRPQIISVRWRCHQFFSDVDLV